VGKSVKGSAMQAVAMSRARARTTTTRSSNSSGKSTKHGTGSNNPGTRVMQRATWRARQNKKGSKSEIKEANDILKHLPSSLAKEYTSIHAFVSKMSFKSFMTVHLFQKMFLSWLSKLKGKEIPILAMEIILIHANFVKSETFPLIQSIVDDPLPFLAYLTKVLSSHDMNTTLLSKNFSWKNEKGPRQRKNSPVMYIMRKDVCSIGKCIMFIYEVAVISHIKLGKIGRCRSWSFIACDEAKNMPRMLEEETELTYLNLKGEMFNFVSNVLRGTVKHHSYSNDYINVPLLLRETRSLFPAQMQRR
jgi:hypothetical protein